MVVVELPVGHDAAAEVVDHDVAVPDQIAREGDATGIGHVDDDAALAPVEIAGQPRAPAAEVGRVAPLDFDDVRVVIRQHAGRDRAGHHPGEVEDADAAQGSQVPLLTKEGD
jgi:hypothetical protein